jgi:hypothetical protein
LSKKSIKFEKKWTISSRVHVWRVLSSAKLD